MEQHHMHTHVHAYTHPAPHRIQGHSHAGHASGHDHAGMINDYRRRFWVVLALTIPVMALSPMIQHWLGFHWGFEDDRWILFGLSSVLFLYGGWPFLNGLKEEMSALNPGMMTLVGFAITVAYLYSVAVTLGLTGMDFYWELATLILIMLLGHWIEMKSIAGAGRELELLVRMLPAEAHLWHGDHVMEVNTDTLQPGDIILIKPGERIAADGMIEEGESYLNESMLTGESKPVLKRAKDNVVAGSINGNGSLRVRVSHAGKDNYLSSVINLVREAQNSKSSTQLLADRAARWLTIIAIGSGLLTFTYWYWWGGMGLAFAIERMVTVIVICCPHALGLAVPLVVAKSTALSAQNGILIKKRTAFEDARKISSLVFDKTGTLTLGEFQVLQTRALAPEWTETNIIRLAAALEQHSEHPIASGILKAATDADIQIPPVTDFQAIPGKGVQGTVEGRQVQAVGPVFLREQNRLPADWDAADNGDTLVFLLSDDTLVGSIVLADAIRPESAEAIRLLKKERIQPVLLTGDNLKVAQNVSRKLGIDTVFAEVLPHRKLEEIKALQAEGAFVGMAGDGVNDAPALAQADVGIAIGSGTDIAAETAGVVLVNSNPKDIVKLIHFGKATYRKMLQNLAWATGYNVITLPLAAGVAAHWGILLSPAAGAILMTLSTVVVAWNARALKIKPA